MTSGQRKLPPLAGKRILVVEDLYLVADDISRILIRHGAEVVGPAATADEAAAIVRKEPIDGALLDVDLRGESVFEIADMLAASGVPFMFATGFERTSLPQKYAGADYLAKPLTPARLTAALEDLLRPNAEQSSA